MTTPLIAAAATRTCTHFPPCPTADATDHDAARVLFHDSATGFSLLCNHVILFEDTGELIPDGGPFGCHAEDPHRGPAPHRSH